MIDWQIYLDDLLIEQPAGFGEIVMNIIRDEKWHGVLFEASTSALRFYGAAFDYLKAKKIQYGVDANVIFRANARCAGEAEYENAITGKLNFSAYRETCGQDCFVILSIEQTSCAMTLKNRFDQKVSIDSNIAVDGVTVLQNYNGLGLTMELATQAIPVGTIGQVSEDGDTVTLDGIIPVNTDRFAIRPTYERVTDESLQISQLIGAEYVSADGSPLSPILLLDDVLIDCFAGEFDYEIRLKGNFNIQWGVVLGTIDYVRMIVGTGEYPGSITVLHQENFPLTTPSSSIGSFDLSYSASLPLTPGEGFYIYFEAEGSGTEILVSPESFITFDPETSINISGSRECPPTDAQVYLVNETLSRAVEAITNRCLTVNSEYYGRTDSEPYAQDADGCGSLRMLTNGLKIRQAEEKEFFASPQELFDGLNAIDNIGFAIEMDGLLQKLRVEPVEYFYQDTKIMDMPLVPQMETQIVQSLIKTLVKVGYKKWEIQSVKGIDEFNSNKEFSTGIASLNNTLDITSNFIAAGYLIEDLRTRTLASTGREDTSFDNDIFIIAVTRTGYTYIVEQGNIESPSDIFSPETAYNWRLRPMYNLIRWAKTIFAAYPILADTASRLFFRSGVGNYEATGELPALDPCRLENRILAENDDLRPADADNTTPIWKPETVTFDYPLSLKEYKLIQATPHGFINLQCGQGEFIKAYISNVEYRPTTGQAQLTLLLKWV